MIKETIEEMECTEAFVAVVKSFIDDVVAQAAAVNLKKTKFIDKDSDDKINRAVF